MTVDPSALQTARLHIGHIRVSWPLLDDARTTRSSRGSGTLGARAAASRDADLRAERADRDKATAYRALAASPAPLSLAVLDAEEEVHTTIVSTVWAVRSDLREWTRGRHGVRHIPTIPATIDGKLTWLTTGLDYVNPTVVDQAATDLTHAARLLARATSTRLDDDWHAVGRRCPHCGQRALFAWRQSTDPREWTVECRGELKDEDGRRAKPCRCAGPDCNCGRPGARAGTRHLWPA